MQSSASSHVGGLRVRRACGLPLLCCCAIVATAFVPRSVAAEDSRVSIKGGIDPDEPSGHNYVWTVTNRHSSPIVSVEFPHYRADMFLAPDGWKTECTYLVNVGVPLKPGTCTAKMDPEQGGLFRGASATFRMRVAPEGAPIGKGTVLVRFADGTQAAVEGVTLPRAPDESGKHAPLIALVVLFVVVVVVREWRQRKNKSPASDDKS